MKTVVMRTCVVTNEKLPKNQLLRIVRTKDDKYFIDQEQTIQGRGCYIKPDLKTIKEACTKKLLNKAFRTNVNESVYKLLLEQKWIQN